MKNLKLIYILFFLMVITFEAPVKAQSTSGGEQAQSELKQEQKREKGRRNTEKKAEEKSDNVKTSPQHGWLFKKKRKKKAAQTESPH